MSSSSSEEQGYYSGEEVDFGDEPALPDNNNFFAYFRGRDADVCPCDGSTVERGYYH